MSSANTDAFFRTPLAERDPEVFGAIAKELKRQQDQIELIASENIVSRAVLEAQGKTDEAEAQYLAAIRLKPDYAEAHNNLSSLAVKRRDVPSAVRYAAEAIRLRPNYAEAHFNLGNAFTLQGATTNAVAEYSAAIRLKPEYPEAYYNLGCAMFLLGRLDEAAGSLSEAVRLQPANAVARAKLAFVLAQRPAGQNPPPARE